MIVVCAVIAFRVGCRFAGVFAGLGFDLGWGVGWFLWVVDTVGGVGVYMVVCACCVVFEVGLGTVFGVAWWVWGGFGAAGEGWFPWFPG